MSNISEEIMSDEAVAKQDADLVNLIHTQLLNGNKVVFSNVNNFMNIEIVKPLNEISTCSDSVAQTPGE